MKDIILTKRSVELTKEAKKEESAPLLHDKQLARGQILAGEYVGARILVNESRGRTHRRRGTDGTQINRSLN